MQHDEQNSPLHLSLSEARERLRVAPKAFIALFEYAECSVELYAPKDRDTQQPHAQDELYFVSRGTGTFRCEERVVAFAPGDVLFVAAHVPHRFETFSDDFETWVVFFGPQGGSKPRS